MPRTSFLLDQRDTDLLQRVMEKYQCSKIQALRLGLLLLDTNPVLRVKLPPHHKTGPKPKAKPEAQ